LLFDPAPKSSRRDFFDSETEIEGVKSSLTAITLTLPGPSSQPLYGLRHEAGDPEPQAAGAPF